MENLDIKKFDPKKAELTTLVENIKKTVISLPGDEKGHQLIKDNKKILQKKRTDIIREFEAERAVANAYSSKVIEIQKDFLSIIAPVEADLDDKIKKIKETFNPILDKNKRICTMLAGHKIVKGPNNRWPKLELLHRKLFDEEMANAHDALGDVYATVRCYFELKDRGIIIN